MSQGHRDSTSGRAGLQYGDPQEGLQVSDEDIDIGLSRRSVTFWMTLSRTGLDVELWLTRPERVDFGDGWTTWSGELAEGGSSFAARWPIGRARLSLGTVPDNDRECLRFSAERAA
jgi:hypothetical protein